MAESNTGQILRVEKGRVLDAYQKASARVAGAALPQMGDMRKLRNAAADIYIRQAEVAAIVEFLIEKKLMTTDEFLRRATDCLNKTADRVNAMNSAIHLPGRH